MTPEQIDSVKASFARMLPLRTDVVNSFYNHLFEAAPAARAMFSDDLSDQKKKFEATLTYLVEALDRPNELEEAAMELAERHVGYGTLPDHYALVGISLLHALKLHAPNGLTKPEATAWLALYAWLSDKMLQVYSNPNDDLGD